MSAVAVRAVVVDDEAPARRRLARMLAEAGVEVVGEAEDGERALTVLRDTRPDVVFLDIRMPGMDGVTLAFSHAAELPRVVFCTAHDEFAVRAFELHAVDYLLKPVRPERLAATVDRLRRLPDASAPEGVTRALAELAPASGTRIIAGARGEVRFFEAASLTRFWSTDKYTAFLADGEEQLTEEPLSSLEARLAPLGFLRIHRAELVRLSAVKALRQTDLGHEVVLDDGQSARVSRRLLAQVRAALGLART